VVVTPEKLINLTVRLAKTPEEWAQGLKGQSALGDEEGLLFVFPQETVRTFSAEGVSFPFDLILINKQGRIVDTFENLTGERNHAAAMPIVAALEVQNGFCKENGVRTGQYVSTKGLSFSPKASAKEKQAGLQEVERKLKENLKRSPGDSDVSEELAVFYIANGKADKAIELFRTLLKKEVTAARLNGMGVACSSMGKREEAVKYFQQAITKDPLLLSAYNNLLRVHQSDKGLEDVTKLLEETVKSHPDFVGGNLSLVRIYLVKGEFDQAEAILRKMESSPEVERSLGDVYLRKGDFARASEHYIEYLKARPYDPHAAELDAFIMVHKVKPEQDKK